MFEMQSRTHFNESRPWRWFSVVVLIAAISLTVSLATRYSSGRVCSDSATTTVQKVSSPSPIRQRLLKNAATWIPPFIFATPLELVAADSRPAPSGPPQIDLFFEKNLYNRPPPFRNPYFS